MMFLCGGAPPDKMAELRSEGGQEVGWVSDLKSSEQRRKRAQSDQCYRAEDMKFQQ